MTDKGYNLRPLWTEILRIYAAYRKVCVRHNLRFFGMGGTALGALRHKGFIPWDDDFDLMMPYADYVKFLEVAPFELPEGLQVITGANSGSLGLINGKVIESRKSVIDEVERKMGCTLPQGVYIDIFPYVGMPRHRYVMWDLLCSCYWRVRESGAVDREYKSLKSRLARMIGKILLVLPGPRSVPEFAAVKQRMSARFPFDEAEWVNVFNWVLYDYCDNGRKLTDPGYPRRWFLSSELYPFEDTTIPLANGIREWLAEYFGDYMKLPPEEDRFPKHGVEKVAPWKYGVSSIEAQ